jgi:uncharacterized protein YdeI (YjbR/CyaY-like superfamily)
MPTPKFFANMNAFRTWLELNAETKTELLVGFYKVGSGKPSISWSESVDEALCFGWIDGVRKRVDELSYTIRFTPRKATSIWSAVNIAKVEKLQAEGRMTEAGLRAFTRRQDHMSKVYAYEQESNPELSPERLREFKRNAKAWAFFESTPPSYKRVILHWVTSAKKPETRASRFATLVRACESGERLR